VSNATVASHLLLAPLVSLDISEPHPDLVRAGVGFFSYQCGDDVYPLFLGAEPHLNRLVLKDAMEQWAREGTLCPEFKETMEHLASLPRFNGRRWGTGPFNVAVLLERGLQRFSKGRSLREVVAALCAEDPVWANSAREWAAGAASTQSVELQSRWAAAESKSAAAVSAPTLNVTFEHRLHFFRVQSDNGSAGELQLPTRSLRPLFEGFLPGSLLEWLFSRTCSFEVLGVKNVVLRGAAE
jgi:hypothetical protein